MKSKRNAISELPVLYLILAVNFVSIIVLSLFNYFAFYHNSRNAYEESFASYAQNVTETSFGNIDEEIMQMMYNIPNLYFSQLQQNEAILAPAKENLEGNPGVVRELVSRLQMLSLSNPGVVSLDIYYENTGTAVTGFSNVHFISDSEELKRYLPWYEAFESQEKNSWFMEVSPHAYPLKEPVFSYVCRTGYSIRDQKGIVIAMHISPESFGDYINEKDGTLEILASDGRLLYRTADTEGKEENMEFSYASTSTGLSYRYTAENRLFFADVNSKSQVFLFNFVISVALNVLVILGISYYSSRIYQRKLADLSEETGVSLDSSGKNFDHSIGELKKEIRTLWDTANRSKDLQRHSAVRSLLLGRKTDEAYQALKPWLEYDSFRMVISQKQEEGPDFSEGLQEELLQWEKEGELHVLVTTMEKGEIVGILNYPEDRKEKLEKQLEERLGNYRITVGISCRTEKGEIRRAYEESLEAARYRFIFPETGILFQDKLILEKRKNHGSHLKLFNSMEKDIDNENLLEFKLHLEMLITSFKSGNYTIDYCLSTLRDLVTLLHQMIQRRGFDTRVMYGYDLRQYCKAIPDIDSYQNWLEGVCEIFLKNILMKKKELDAEGDLKEKLTRLIDENLERDISLDFLCDKLSLRPDVLSRTFKQVMGEGYGEYVKKKKMERAVELLDSGSNMKEIAQRLGYSSPQYFIKVFKEFYGKTPFQFKKSRQ